MGEEEKEFSRLDWREKTKRNASALWYATSEWSRIPRRKEEGKRKANGGEGLPDRDKAIGRAEDSGVDSLRLDNQEKGARNGWFESEVARFTRILRRIIDIYILASTYMPPRVNDRCTILFVPLLFSGFSGRTEEEKRKPEAFVRSSSSRFKLFKYGTL